MNTLQKVLIGGLVIALILGGVALAVSLNKTPEVAQGLTGPKGDKGEVGARGPIGPAGPRGPQGLPGEPGTSVGAVTSPDIPYKYISVGGLRLHTGRREELALATTTSCALESPLATSSLISFGINFTTATTAEAERILTVHRQDAPFGTTSTSDELGSTTIGGNKLLSWEWGSSTVLFGDFVNDNFDPAEKERVGRMFIPVGARASSTAQNLVFTQVSSNNDNEASIGQPHGLSGTCEALWMVL